MAKIIIDTDMLIDDWMAILFLCQRFDQDVLGLSVAGTGGCYLDPGVKNALSLLKILDLDSKIPVCPGVETPSIYSNVYPANIRANATHFMGLPIPPSPQVPDPRTIGAFYCDLLSAAAEPVTIVLIGGASNMAQALDSIAKNPKAQANLGHIYIMGGALDTAGNLGDLTDAYNFNTVAEWNVFIDVLAMKVVFERAGCPITLIPLDACEGAPITPEFAKLFHEKTKGSAANWVGKMLDLYTASQPSLAYDPLAATVLVNDLDQTVSDLVTRDTISLTIAQQMKTSGTADTAGQTLRDSAGTKIDCCTASKQSAFEQVFIKPFL